MRYSILNKTWFQSILLCLAWLLIWQAGLLLEYREHVSLWFPPAGLSFAAFYVIGRAAIAPIVIACIISTYWSGVIYNMPHSLGALTIAGFAFAVAHVLPYFFFAALYRSWSSHHANNLPNFVLTGIVTVVLASLIATCTILTSLLVTDMLPVEQFSSAFLPFWLGDFAGLIALSPLLMAILARLLPERGFSMQSLLGNLNIPASPHYKYKLLLISSLTIVVMLVAAFTGLEQSGYAIFFLVLPHMWIACTESALFNLISVALTSVTIALLVQILGLFDFAFLYQFAISLIAANAVFGLAIPKLTEDNQQLRQLVFTDSLTNVASRQRLMEHAEAQLKLAQREGQLMALVVFDIDNFKTINDDFGHRAGDEALKVISETAQKLLRPSDILGRFGGDEFVILLPQTTEQSAVEISERIRTQIEQISELNCSVSASFGVADSFSQPHFNSLFELADKALYIAKNRGRNQVCCASDLRHIST